MFGAEHSWTGIALVLVPAVPLIAALLAYALRRAPVAGWLGTGALALSAALSGALLAAGGANLSVPWFVLPNSTTVLGTLGQESGLAVPLAFAAGQTQLLFLLTTSLIGLAVVVFGMRERRGDERAGVFHATLTLFAGSMLLFLAADTLLLVYLAWELMGVCSYLLIAHRATPEAWRAARQAFWTTRATDFGLLFALIILHVHPWLQWPTFSSIDFGQLISGLAQAGLSSAAIYPWLGAVAFLVLGAVLGKAAQFPLHFWLADAMVAPAPVSALLHAATMVAAGPYLLIRLHTMFATSDMALLAAVLLGGLTLLLGAAMALCAADPKRILAYSTVSHLGLVVLSVGVFAEEAGYFHLLSHAWFKAALFLGVGYLIAAVAGGSTGSDLGSLAGTARRSPLVLWGILVPAGLSLMGVPLLAGALGKEQVLYALLTRHSVKLAQNVTLGSQYPLATAAWTVGATLMILGLPLTAAYITRLVGVLGWGRAGEAPGSRAAAAPSESQGDAVKVAGWRLGLGLTVCLALIGSIGGSLLYRFWYATERGFWDEAKAWKWSAANSPVGLVVLLLAAAGVLLGAGLTWYWRVARPGLGERIYRDGNLAPLVGVLGRGLYFREFFQTVVGRTGELLAILAGIADVGVVDWLALRCGAFGRWLAGVLRWVDDHVVEGARFWACEVWWMLKRLHARAMQTGRIQHYMFIVLLGTVALCLVILKPLAAILDDILGRR